MEGFQNGDIRKDKILWVSSMRVYVGGTVIAERLDKENSLDQWQKKSGSAN